jgi:hypothetical protein
MSASADEARPGGDTDPAARSTAPAREPSEQVRMLKAAALGAVLGVLLLRLARRRSAS